MPETEFSEQDRENPAPFIICVSALLNHNVLPEEICVKIRNRAAGRFACKVCLTDLKVQSMLLYRKIGVLCAAILCGILLTACGQDEELTAYQEDMNTFFEHIAALNDSMNSIDASAEDATAQLLSYLDQLQAELTWMAELTVPEQFSAADSLADEADENMRQAVALYHSAYEAEVFDEPVAQAAREYYDRANIRIQYIISILHGEIPEGEGVTYTEESGILGGGYLNKTDEEETDDTDSGLENGEPEVSEDNFDTDDTVFYEEPETDTTQESTQENE